MRRGRGLAAALVVASASAWGLVACGHENDDAVAVCPDVATFFAAGNPEDIDYPAVVEAIDCDGVTTAREERCLRTPWARAPSAEFFAGKIGPTPEEAVRITAGDDTVITQVLSRTRGRARIAVELDGDTGVYDVQRLRAGWLAVAGEGCATGAASDDEPDEPISEECERSVDEATPGPDGTALTLCIESLDGPVPE